MTDPEFKNFIHDVYSWIQKASFEDIRTLRKLLASILVMEPEQYCQFIQALCTAEDRLKYPLKSEFDDLMKRSWK